MLYLRRAVHNFEIGKGMGAALIAQQQRVTLRVVARAGSALHDLHQTPVGILSVPRGDALRNNGALGVFPDMDHLSAGIRLLVVVRQRHRVKLPDRVVTLQDAARVFPGDRRAGLYLRPRDLRILAETLSPLGDKIIDAALAFLVARIPVLHRGVLDLGILESDQLYDRGVQLVLIAHRRGASLQVTHIAAFVGDDQRALELTRFGGVDAKVSGQLHRTAHPFRDVTKRAVTEDGGVERREEVVGVGHDRAEIFPDQLRVIVHRLGKGAKDDPHFAEFLFERRRHRDTVKDRIHRDPGENLLLSEGDTQLLVGRQQLRVHFIEALGPLAGCPGRRIVDDPLVIDRRIVDIGPFWLRLRLCQLLPMTVCLQTPIEHPFGLVLLGRDQADDLFVESGRNSIFFNLCDKPVLVFPVCQGLHCAFPLAHQFTSPLLKTLAGYTVKEVPQPHERFTLGF